VSVAEVVSGAAARPTALRNASIGFVALALFAGTAARYVLSPMQEIVRLDLGFSDNQIALLQGMAVALPAALFSIPVGRIVDKADRTRLLVVLALVCAAGTLLMAFAHDFYSAFASRMLVGASVAAAQPAAISLVADLSDSRHRGRMVTLIALGQVLGVTAAYALAGVLLQRLPALFPASGWLGALPPWRLVQVVFALAVLVAAALLCFMREPARREAGTALGGTLRQALRELWGYRSMLVPLVTGMVTVGMADAAASIWAVPVLTRTFHQTPADFGAWMGVLNLGCGLVGAALGGFAADFGQRSAGRGGVLLGAVLGAALSIPAALFPVMPSVAGFAVLMALLLTSGACVNIAATSAVTVLLPNELRGICISLMAGIIGMVAVGVAPLLVSLSAQVMGRGSDIVAPLTWVGVLTSVCGTLAFIHATRVVSRRAGTSAGH
jgi:MFS family permease